MRTTIKARTSRSSGSAERGSAYLVALLVLVVLSVVGLSLVLITQTEAQIGANERIINRNFYAADSGIAVSVARVLISGIRSTLLFKLDEANATANQYARQDEVSVAPAFTIGQNPCNLCQINSKPRYYRFNHLIASRATRYGVVAGDRHPMAQKNITAMVEVQPIEAPSNFDDLDSDTASFVADNFGTGAGQLF